MVRKARTPKHLLLTLVVGLGLVMTACAKNAPQNTLSPEGPVAKKIDSLFTLTFWIAVGVFVIVEGGVVYLVWRYRHRDGRPEPKQVHGNTRLEITWTVLPALLLAFVAIPTFATIFELAKEPKNPIRVTVIGHQFWWEYHYEDLGVTAANELHMPTGRPVELTLKSADVIHSFWIPKLAGKHDVEPGRVSRIHMTASKPGTYLGQCAEFCGLSHANMRLRGIAQTPADFDAWVQAQKQQAAPAPPGTAAADGFVLFGAKGCGGCHTVAGVSEGQVGPNLTHVYSRQAFAGDTFDMTPANLQAWLLDPPGVKPGAKMPNLGLTPTEAANIVAYLQTLK